jgi:hypothetical protein
MIRNDDNESQDDHGMCECIAEAALLMYVQEGLLSSIHIPQSVHHEAEK